VKRNAARVMERIARRRAAKLRGGSPKKIIEQ
jgi:hypothetical protein